MRAVYLLPAVLALDCSLVSRLFDVSDMDQNGILDADDLLIQGWNLEELEAELLSLPVEPWESFTKSHRTGATSAISMLTRSTASYLTNETFIQALQPLCTQDTRGPEQIKTMSNGPGGLFIGWAIPEDVTPRNLSKVRYGFTPQNLSFSAQAELSTYDVGTGWKGWVYKSYLTTLRELTDYYYQVGDNVTQTWSSIIHFRTPLYNYHDNVSAPITRLAVYADIGTAIPAGFLVTQRIVNDTVLEFGNLTKGLDGVLAPGDLAYGNCCTKEELEWVWDIWGRQTQVLASSIPFATVTGNHERQYNYSAFSTRYYNPGNISNGTMHYYSYQVGLVWVVVISTEESLEIGSPQREWLEADLAAARANHQRTPWIVASCHFPMYASDFGVGPAFGPGSPIQLTLEPVLVQYGVDMLFTGHHHVYERTFPVINGTVIGADNTPARYIRPGAPTHVMVGTGGGVYPDVWHPKPEWSVARIWHYGYGHLTAYNATHLRFQFRQLNLRSAFLPSDIRDEFWIIH